MKVKARQTIDYRPAWKLWVHAIEIGVFIDSIICKRWEIDMINIREIFQMYENQTICNEWKADAINSTNHTEEQLRIKIKKYASC